MKYFKKLLGDKCYLSPVCFDEIDKYTEWVNDMETGLYVLFASSVIDVNKERNLLEYLTKHDTIMAIVEKETNKSIGICGLHNINEVHRTANFGIFLGDKNYWGHGIGTEATLLTLDYAFNILNLNSVSLEVIDFNKRAIRSYEKCGFQFVGKKRKAIFMAGIYHDLLIYDYLAADFQDFYLAILYKQAISCESDTAKIDLV
ncbi:MAG: GNAT family protein [Candidatus Cloacimonadaceae bacterium]